jgi:FixJ family two-component response regulator
MEASRIITVAVVDDDESLCRSLARLLRVGGFAPTVFPSAEELLHHDLDRFDCLLVDIQLGGMSGVELQEHLTATGSRTPLIFITAHDDPAVRDRAIGGGCAAYFKKTDAGEAILENIRSATVLNNAQKGEAPPFDHSRKQGDLPSP